MISSASTEPLDFVEELRLRRWAREHYAPANSRDPHWHPVVLEEMTRRDRELAPSSEPSTEGRIVPLAAQPDWMLHGPHADASRTTMLMSVPFVPRGS